MSKKSDEPPKQPPPVRRQAAKPEPEKQPEPPAASTALVRVIVLCNSLGEAGNTYAHGETFETTPERADALGNSVAIAT